MHKLLSSRKICGRKVLFGAKSTIPLFLGSARTIRAREIIDEDNRTAKELWDFLEKLIL